LAGFIRLSYLTDIVNNKTNNQVSENSYSLILNSNGRVAAHPDSDKVLARNWLQPSQDSKVDTQASTEEIENMSEGFREVVQQMTDGKTGFKITNVDGERSIVAYQPLGISKMSIATVIPTDDAFSVLIKITNFLKLGVAILTVIFILVIYFMLKAIIGPIKEASEFAEQIANGNLDIDNLEQNYDDELVGTCLKCGIEIRSIKGKKKKRFCSDRCRWDWWNNHITEEKLKSRLQVNQQNHIVSK
jgi:methyl-accepting chemotaxis protein